MTDAFPYALPAAARLLAPVLAPAEGVDEKSLATKLATVRPLADLAAPSRSRFRI